MRPALILCLGVALFSATELPAQVNYVARFEMEKQEYLLGGPVFCKFTIRNTGSETFQFAYRSPSRVLVRGLAQEPRFRVTDAAGHRLPDPAPRPCGGTKGTVVYGSVTLPPGQTHTERWLLNEWAKFSAPGKVHVRGERRLPLHTLVPRTQSASKSPAAFALALNELEFTLVPATEAQLQPLFQPYLDAVKNPKESNPAEAALVLTTLPQAFFISTLEAMASGPSGDRWDRRLALEGLARLGTTPAWDNILKVAEGKAGDSKGRGEKDYSLRSYAILLLAEKGEDRFLPALLQMLPTAQEPLRDDLIRALGFFPDPQASQALFDKLHSENANERMNAILGLKNLGKKESIPALMAMLNDADPQVRQVANFALQGLTGEKLALPARASREEATRVAGQWHAWWREKGGSFNAPRTDACREW